ncbi:hypothetical protein [Nocardia sp. CDC160]|uniref:hypothetical protein n=1 Tax=Nocardia sp. CDC160 TaxID=3112166 RepID=UPI002DB9660F|nr:hypothetical protein [Nocardia sp. CDC160]MEC3917758.1 hypothetical protein [Nocardia sp. CDC160]
MKSNGLDLELATRRLSGPLIAGRHPRIQVVLTNLFRAPAFVLMALLLVVPALYTIGLGARTNPGLALGCGLQLGGGTLLLVLDRSRDRRERSPLARALLIGLRVLAAVVAVACLGIGTRQVWRGLPVGSRAAYLHTAGWVVLAVVLVLLALLLAWPSRHIPWLWWPFIVPFGVSAFTAGIAFRFILETTTGGRYFDHVATDRLAFEAVLVAAFAWTWLGLLIGLFRAAILAIEADPVRAGELYHGREPFLLFRLWKQVRPVAFIAFLVVSVAAARVFDAVLGAVPRSLQRDVGTATVEWWRLSTACEAASCGDAAAYALQLTVALILAALLSQDRINARRPSGPPPVGRLRPGARTRTRLWRAVFVIPAVALVLYPIGELVYVAMYGTAGSPGIGVRDLLSDPALRRALLTTAEVAASATVIAVTFALPVAYWLAASRIRMVVPGLVILTVLPAQMYLGSLQQAIGSFGWFGTLVPLIFTHAAAGLPISILVLRGALLAPAYTPAADALYGLASLRTILGRTLSVVGPAVGAVAVLELIQVWNDFFLGLLISGTGGSPWSLLLWADTRQFSLSSAQLAGEALVSAVVPLALLLVSWRRWLVPGLTGGARI